MPSRKLLLLSALVLALSACGGVVIGPGTPQQNKLQIVADDLATRAPTADLTQSAVALKDASGKFTINRRDPIHAFEEGKAYFRTFALSPAAAGHTLEIRSYYSLDFPTTLFVPALLYLDASQQILARHPAPAFKTVNGFGEHIEVLDPIPANAAYVVIYTTPARVAERMVFKTYSMTGVVPTPSFDAKDTGFGGFYEGILHVKILAQ